MSCNWYRMVAIWCITGLLAVLPAGVFAEQFLQDGDYRIYYNSFPSTLIPDSVATLYGITRSDSRYITNISIHKNDVAVSATVSGFTTNLLDQKTPLEFEEIKEPSAIYYLANSVLGSSETVRFTILIQLDDRELPIKLEYVQSFFP